MEVSGGVVCAAAGVLTYGVRGRSSSLLAPSVYHGVRSRRSIALTFDDGPSESTRKVLEVLERYRVPATFFQCGVMVRRYAEIAREVALAGHEIGNHSDTHARLDFRSPAFMFRELDAAQRAIRGATGITPRYFRAPFGVRWFGLRGVQHRLNLMGVMWTVIGRDWKLPGERVAERVLAGARNGAIFCLHDGRLTAPAPDIGSTLDAIRRIIPVLLDEGFRFETVSQILCPTT